MNDTMQLIEGILRHALEDIENGKIYATERQLKKGADLLGYIFSPSMSRQEVLEELGICDTTLRKKLKTGAIPKGKKIRGQTAHKWSKADIERLKRRKCDV